MSALFGFTQFLIQLIRRIQPRFIAVAHDESLFTGFRHKLSPDYKSNRELPDENLGMQLAGCLEVSSLLGVSTFSSKVYEADDIIGTLATKIRLSTPNTSIQILTKDKDLAQLLTTENRIAFGILARTNAVTLTTSLMSLEYPLINSPIT